MPEKKPPRVEFLSGFSVKVSLDCTCGTTGDTLMMLGPKSFSDSSRLHCDACGRVWVAKMTIPPPIIEEGEIVWPFDDKCPNCGAIVCTFGDCSKRLDYTCLVCGHIGSKPGTDKGESA